MAKFTMDDSEIQERIVPINLKGITAYDTFSMSFLFHTPQHSIKITDKKEEKSSPLTLPLTTIVKRADVEYKVTTGTDPRFLGFTTIIKGPFDEEEMDQYGDINDAIKGHKHFCYHVKRLGDSWEDYPPCL